MDDHGVASVCHSVLRTKWVNVGSCGVECREKI